MNRIKIRLEDQWNFNYSTDDHDLLLAKSIGCVYCDTKLDHVYSYIITQLDKADLLPDDYKPACCYCYTLEKFGLLDFINDLDGFFYDKETDILEIGVTVFEFFKNKEVKFFDSAIRIHEYSKWS